MVTYRKNKDILKCKAELITNAVNCVGVMGAGLAKQFKDKYPNMFAEYKKACKNGEVKIGKCHFWQEDKAKQWICNFPTKEHWNDCSYYSSIIYGLNDLYTFVKENGIKSVAVPKLGCGLGTLDWSGVHPIILDVFKDYKGELIIYN